MRVWRDRLVFGFAVVLAGLTLRPTLAAIGPLLEDIQRDTGLSDVMAGMLTTLPVFLMGLCMFGAVRMRVMLGERAGMVLGLALIALCSAMRWFGSSEAALVGTALLGGVGIAMVQALMPRVIRYRGGAASPQIMALFTTAIMSGAMLASASGPWVAQGYGWTTALGIWAIPAAVAAVFWGMSVPESRAEETEVAEKAEAEQGRLYRHARTWQLLLMFGLLTAAYTLVLAWLPPFYMGLGWSAEAAGAALAAVTLSEVVSGLMVSIWVSRFKDRRPAMLIYTGLLAAGLLCLVSAPQMLVWPAIIMMGLGIGGMFPLSLIVSMDHGRNADEAGALVGFVQAGGYMLAAFMPLAAGLLRQQFSDLTLSWWLMLGLCAVLALIAIRLKPGQDVTGRSAGA